MLEENIQSVPHVKEPRRHRYDDTPDMSFSEEWHYLVARHGYFKTVLFFLLFFFAGIFMFIDYCFEQIYYYCHKLLTKDNVKERRRK